MTAALAVSLCGCVPGGGGGDRAATTAIAEDAACDVTIPNGKTPPGETPTAWHHGNGSVWTAYAPTGVIESDEVRDDGSLAIKFGWWISEYSGTTTMDQELSVSGKRIDADAPLLRVEMPCCYYGGFQASSLVFATSGCWRIEARPMNGLTLAFVVQVEREFDG